MSDYGIIEIQLRSQSGSISTIRCTDILSIDGKPYQHEDNAAIRDVVAQLNGRVDTLENLVNNLILNLFQPPDVPELETNDPTYNSMDE